MVGMLAAASPGLAHDLSIGLTLHHNMTCLKGSFTGVRGEPFDLFGDAGKSFECGSSTRHFGGGFILTVPLSERLALRLGPGFMSHGYEYQTRQTVRVPLHYLELPAQVRVALSSDRARPYVVVGAFVSRRVNGEATIDDETAQLSSDPSQFVFVRHKENWRRWNFGVTGGAGVDVALRHVGLLFEVTYDRGLVDVYSARNLSEHVQSLRVAAGLTLPLGRRPPAGAATRP
jgi:hypothetical protein